MGTEAVIIQIILNGMMLGIQYALIAVGFTLFFGVLDIINFSHGDVFMLGAFIGLILINIFSKLQLMTGGASYVIVLFMIFFLCVLITGAIGIFFERITVKRVAAGPGLVSIPTIGGFWPPCQQHVKIAEVGVSPVRVQIDHERIGEMTPEIRQVLDRGRQNHLVVDLVPYGVVAVVYMVYFQCCCERLEVSLDTPHFCSGLRLEEIGDGNRRQDADNGHNDE